MELYQDVIRDQKGVALPNVLVTVRDSDGKLALLKDAGGAVTIKNPVGTDEFGLLSFQAPYGYATLEYRVGGQLLGMDVTLLGQRPAYDLVDFATNAAGAAEVVDFGEGADADADIVDFGD